MTPISLRLNISTTIQIDSQFKLTTYGKPHTTKLTFMRLMISLVTNGDNSRLGGLLGTKNDCRISTNED